jgi:serine protease
MTLLLSCGGGGGGGGGNDEPATPPTVALSASPDIVAGGQTTTITWTSSPGTANCEAYDGWSGTLPASGSATSPAIYTTTEFSIRCTNPAGTRSRTVLVNVSTPELTLTATPTVVRRGEPVTLSWRSRDFDRCEAAWDAYAERPVNGSETVVPASDETDSFHRQYILRCSGAASTLERTALVRVMVLRGAVLVPNRVVMDGDVNDPEAPHFPNDSLEDAEGLLYRFQRIGYVNQPLSGPEGRSYASGDISDFSQTESFETGDVAFRLTLPGVDLGQPVGQRADADLYVYDSLGNLIDASVGAGREELVVVPGGDDYYLEVRAVSGGVMYLLEIEPSPEALGTHNARLAGEFVPDEALVILAPTGSGAYKAEEGTDFALRRLGLARKAGAAGRELRVALPAQGARVSAAYSPPGTRMTAEQRRRLSTLLDVKALAARPGVRAASTNRIFHAERVPDDPDYAKQRWHYGLIGLPQAWDITTGSPTVTVAVVDSGVVRNHPDLQSRLRDGYDMVSDPANADGDGLDADPDDHGASGEGDVVYHGTHVAGTIGAVSNNGVGVAGVDWNAAIMPVRVLDDGSGTTYDVLQGVRYAAGLPNDSGILPARRADIINLSLGLNGECEAVEAAVYTEVRNAGVVVVASAGNDGSNFEHAPSTCPGVFSVGAVGGSGERAAYSNFGRLVDLAAPGGDVSYDADQNHLPDAVFSTHAKGPFAARVPDYGPLYGTSMAAPHVSGVFALMKSVAPTLTPVDFERLLAAGALTDDPLQHPRDEVGYGVLDALKAVRAATGDFDGSPRLDAMPTVMRFEGNTASAGLRLSNGGGGVLTVSAMHASTPWIQMRPASVDANGLGSWQVIVDRSDLPFNGTRNGSIEIVTSAGNRTVPVLVADGLRYTETRGEFPIYVKIVDADTGIAERVTRLPDFGGYRIDDLSPGRYFISAGTDIDHDGDFCNAGELCGENPFYGLHEYLDYVDTSEGIDVPLVLTAKQEVLD